MSAGIGLGGGKGEEQVTSPAASNLVNLANQIMTGIAPVGGGLLDAMQEVLQTGGSTIPIISRSVEASRQAGSKALAGTEEELARKGLVGTPFGEQILASTAQQGDIAAGQVGQSLAQMIFSMIPGFVMGQSQTALGGLAGAIPGMQTTKSKGKGAGLDLGFGD